MNINYIKEIVEGAYNIRVERIEKIKSTYRINGNEGYCLKIVNYEYSHFYFILSCIKHLERKNLTSILNIIETEKGREYIKIDNKYAYLTKWVKSEISDFNNLDLVEKIGEEVSKMHLKSRGFIIPGKSKPRMYWGKWIEIFENRKIEIYDFKRRIGQKAYKNKFDKLYLENFGFQIEEASKTIESLKKSNYKELMEKEVMQLGFCHHDLENHNILVDEKNNIKFIDFDYCILDSHLHDLGSLIWRVNRYSEVDEEEKVKRLLKGYQKNIRVAEEERLLIKIFLSFPNDFWQRGLQVYWEQQPWEEEFMIGKLEEYLRLEKKKKKVIECI